MSNLEAAIRVFLHFSQNSQESTRVRVSSLIKFQACNFIQKETLAQVFSCECYEISKNNFLLNTYGRLLLKV